MSAPSSPPPAGSPSEPKITRILLAVWVASKTPANAEITTKVAAVLKLNPSVSYAAMQGPGTVEVHYDAECFTLGDLLRPFSKTGLRIGIT